MNKTTITHSLLSGEKSSLVIASPFLLSLRAEGAAISGKLKADS